ncbi:MAG: amidase [Ferrimicrobium sp.]
MPINPWSIGPIVEPSEPGIRVIVKDLFDLEGTVTSAGSRLVASRHKVALADAPLVSIVRANGGQIIGKANLVECAYGSQGVNPWFGTPINPISPELIPGGSSSGSAVAVANDYADVGVGTDTGGSIRLPAACSGLVGLKPTYGTFTLEGTWPLAPTLDTAGPLTRDLATLRVAWELFGGTALSRDLPVDLAVMQANSESVALDDAIREVLALSDLAFRPAKEWPFEELWQLGNTVMGFEAVTSTASIWEERHRIDPRIADRLVMARTISQSAYHEAIASRSRWQQRCRELLGGDGGVLVLPTIPFAIPDIAHGWDRWLNQLTLPFNYLGFPALSVPIHRGRDVGQGQGANGVPVPLAVQFVGAPGCEALIVAVAERVLAGVSEA